MNPEAGKAIGAGIMAGIQWVLLPRHIIIATLIVAGLGGGLMILHDWWRLRGGEKKEDKQGRGATKMDEKALQKKLRRR